MKLDLLGTIKLVMIGGTLLFTIAGFYYTTTNDINALSLKVRALESENRGQQQRLDSIDKHINRFQKHIRKSHSP